MSGTHPGAAGSASDGLTADAADSTGGKDPFWHPALFYDGEDEYLAGTVPFVADGVAAGEPVAVAVPTWRLGPLRDAVAGRLGRGAGGVHWLDMTEAGRNPGRIIPAVLREFADRHPGRRVRIIGEPIWPSRSAAEYPACAQHEALINPAFTGRAVSILCPYDAGGLDPRVLDEAARTHPVLMDAAGTRASGHYAPDTVVDEHNEPLPDPPEPAERLRFDLATLDAPRALAVRFAAAAGAPERRVLDIELVVSELTANSIRHGGGAGDLALWQDGAHLVVEVRDRGRLTDPLAGRRPVAPDAPGGRGLLLVNQLSDLVRVHTGADGTTVRAYFATGGERG
ncbi:anti-sigma factor RsbA family regulatory protein [Actinomadura verrucosospora]|uniref:Regulator of sigma factor n=1 Tax=Actinomadura verrucosospora TaxID=46165 RepID=A0A7D3VUN6_ACTVE|nr:anti-sigma factor RsbA family regulatory protein [Actinomadura verrucosospora]QKG23520.1 regulator of sigma factor [Actinomadura verrucosospora]